MSRWGECTLAGETAVLYGHGDTPTAAYTPVALYFPENMPDGSPSRELTIALKLNHADPPNGIAPIDSVPVGLILGGPTGGRMTLDSTWFFYRSTIAPFVEGDWSLELTWSSPFQADKAYIPLTVTTGDPSNTVIPVGSWRRFVVLAWLEPLEPTAGPHLYRLLAWRASQGGQVLSPDTTLTLTLSVPSDDTTGVPDSSVALLSDGAYTGELAFPDQVLWNVKTLVARDSLLIGEGVFRFTRNLAAHSL